MPRAALISAATAISFILSATPATPATPATAGLDRALPAEQWKTRPLVVFASRADDPALLELKSELMRQSVRSKFKERGMVLYTVVGDEAWRDDRQLPSGEADRLRRALLAGAAAPFRAVLIGKDGGVKVRQVGKVDLSALFVTIDGMPMRAR